MNNPTLPENTDGYETQLHHALGHDLTLRELSLLVWNDDEILPPYLWVWFRDNLTRSTPHENEADSATYGDFVKVFAGNNRPNER